MRSRRALDFRRIKLVETVDYVDKDANIADISCIQCVKKEASVEKVPFEKKHGQRNTEISGAKRSGAKSLRILQLPVPDMARRREELDKIFGQIELRKQKRLKCERKTPRIPDCDEPWSTNKSPLSELLEVKFMEPLAVSPSLSPLISPLLSPFDNKQEHCFLTERFMLDV